MFLFLHQPEDHDSIDCVMREAFRDEDDGVVPLLHRLRAEEMIESGVVAVLLQSESCNDEIEGAAAKDHLHHQLPPVSSSSVPHHDRVIIGYAAFSPFPVYLNLLPGIPLERQTVPKFSIHVMGLYCCFGH